jgi:hypothetical protein
VSAAEVISDAPIKQDEPVVWCYDAVQGADGSVGTFGHPPELPTYEGNPGEGETYLSTDCFSSWADAAAFISIGAIQLPEDATKQDYVEAVTEHAQKQLNHIRSQGSSLQHSGFFASSYLLAHFYDNTGYSSLIWEHYYSKTCLQIPGSHVGNVNLAYAGVNDRFESGIGFNYCRTIVYKDTNLQGSSLYYAQASSDYGSLRNVVTSYKLFP